MFKSLGRWPFDHPRWERDPTALLPVKSALCTDCHQAYSTSTVRRPIPSLRLVCRTTDPLSSDVPQARCQICQEAKAKCVIYGPYEKRQPSSIALKGKKVKSRLPPFQFVEVPGGARRNHFEPTHVELQPLGEIEAPLDPKSLSFGPVPYVVRGRIHSRVEHY